MNKFIIQIERIVEEQASADVEIEEFVITIDKIQKKVEQQEIYLKEASSNQELKRLSKK